MSRAARLTPTMLRHLREMDDGSREGLVWYPSGGELRSADALSIRCLVVCADHRLGAYVLTSKGRARIRDSRGAQAQPSTAPSPADTGEKP